MSVRQRDVAAAVKGAVAAGVEVARVEVDKEGRIIIIAGKPSEESPTAECARRMDGKECAFGLKALTRSANASLTAVTRPTGTLGRAARPCAANPARPNSMPATTKPSRPRSRHRRGILFVCCGNIKTATISERSPTAPDELCPADHAHRGEPSRLPAVGPHRPAHPWRVHGLARPDRFASSTTQADYAWTVLARVLSWSFEPRTDRANPCERGGRLYRGSERRRFGPLMTKPHSSNGPAHLHLPLLLALWTGQRQGDLLRLPWSAYDGIHIRLRQGKGGARVVIPVGAPLKAALDATPKRSTIILTNSEGKPWTSDGFRASWGKACKRAGVVGLTFHDLRGTAVTRLAIAGCTEAEIATITGHSLRGVRAILDTHYLIAIRKLGDSAITKLERGTKSPD